MKPVRVGTGWPGVRDYDTTVTDQADQATLFDAKSQTSLDSAGRNELTLEDRFNKFNLENPHVLAAFAGVAGNLLAAGYKRYGARAILERVRWDLNLNTASDEFKINNNFVAFYARKLIAQDPRFQEFFALRTQGAKRAGNASVTP